MTLGSRYLTPLLVAAGVASSTAVAPVATADPVGGYESPSATIEDLKAQGYDVAINWVNGNSTSPLSECSVTGIHNPNPSAKRPKFTTVYIDISCPDHNGTGFIFGFGVG